MPYIDPEILKSTVYLYPSEAEAEDGEALGGSGFFVSVYSDADINDRLTFLVTNRHVKDSGNTVARINTDDGGTDTLALDDHQWLDHPDGDDLTLCLVKPPDHFSYCSIPHSISLPEQQGVKWTRMNGIISKEIIEQFDIGPGDETFTIGRFVNHEGKKRNLPSLRFGNIAQMPWEPIRIDGHDQESFLVEARSISGYSGAPVFVYLPPRTDINPELVKSINEGNMRIPGVNTKRLPVVTLGPWLLGINYAYIRKDEPVFSRATQRPVEHDWFVRSNTGMMAVVPAWRIFDIIDGPQVKSTMDDFRARMASKHGQG
jgi:hypothetical protein